MDTHRPPPPTLVVAFPERADVRDMNEALYSTNMKIYKIFFF